MRIELEREEDGRWLTEIPELPGVMAYGRSEEEVLAKVKALALRVMADRLEQGEDVGIGCDQLSGLAMIVPNKCKHRIRR